MELKEVSTERKLDLIGLTIEEAYIDGIVNPMLLDILFLVNKVLIYAVTDILPEEKNDKVALYDRLKKEGVFSEFELDMNQKYPGELEMLDKYLNLWVEDYKHYINSVNGILDSLKIFATDIAEKLGENLQSLDKVDLEQLGQLVPLAKSLGIDLEKKNE